MASESLSRSQRALRYVPLIAAGVLVFLGLVFLGKLTGLLWHSRTFGWWIPLDSSVLTPTADWIIWGFSFLLSVFPIVLTLAFRRTRRDPVLMLTCFLLPLLSVVTVAWSFHVGATLLVASGLLAAYALVSRSRLLLGMERASAVRVVCLEVFAFLALVAAGGVVSVLLWHGGVFSALICSDHLTDPWLRMSSVDMEVFYLARPLFLEIFIVLAVVAILALFREEFRSITRLVIGRLVKEERLTSCGASPEPKWRSGRNATLLAGLPYLILVASVALGVAITTYPYTVAKVGGVLGSDMWFYAERLRVMTTAANPYLMLEADRGLFFLILFAIMNLTDLEVNQVLILAPALCSILLAISAFALVKEGTGRPWLAGLAALLSVVSAQTSLGMGAGILANWFALSLVNFTFALVLRWIRLRSKVAAFGSLALSLVLLGSYTYMWVATVTILAVALVATLLSFRPHTRDRWRRESTFLAAVLGGTIAVPIVLAYTAMIPLVGHIPAWFDPGAWMNMAWNYVVGRLSSQVLALAPSALEEAFDFAGNRIDLPFLTLLSIVGLADSAWDTSFRRIVAAMVLVPVLLAVVSPNLYLTWRGLYMIPLYLTGALGVETVIRTVNGDRTPWKTRSRLAFAGAFASYVFLSHLGYSLRALELLIIVGAR